MRRTARIVGEVGAIAPLPLSRVRHDILKAIASKAGIRTMTERTTNPEWLEQWQRDYDKAVGRGGRVRDVFARLGKAGGLAIWVEVDESGPAESDRGVVYYSPYLDSMPGDNHRDDPEPDDYCTCPLCEYRLDSGDWLDSMTHATDWGEWDWGDGSDEVLGH